MSKVKFSHSGEDWWFDPESGEYEYDGPSGLVKVVLENMGDYSDVQTGNLQGIYEHPGEVWRELSPEETKRKVLNYLSDVNGVTIHERKKAYSN